MGKLFLFGLALLLTLSTIGFAQATTYQEIKAVQVKKMMGGGDVLVVYPLSRIEYNDLHIKGSINITVGNLAKELPQDKNRKLIFYCLGRK